MYRIWAWMKFLQRGSIVDRFLYSYLLPLAAAFLLVAIGIYFFVESVPLLLDIVRGAPVVQQPEIATNQQAFKDVLQTVLAVAALAIAAFGYGTYKILSSQIEDRIITNTEARYQKSLGYQRASLGYANWILYKNSKEQPESAKSYLEEAIRHTRIAFYENAVKLNAQETEYEHMVCQIRNNLAFFMSEKHIKCGPLSDDEMAECISLANWLEVRIDNHPPMSRQYRDTIENVRKRLSMLKGDETAES